MRWKALIPTTLILALIAVCTVFFLDGWVKCAIERLGTTVNGAKVDLGSAQVKLLDLSVRLHKLQVTDKDNPMTNALEIESLRFDVAGKPLTWKKIIIEKADIQGIRTGTPRKKSGALTKKQKKTIEQKAAKKTREIAKKAASFAMTNLKEEYDPKKMVQLENLEAYKKTQEEQTRLTALANTWEKRLDAAKTQDIVKETESFIQRIKNEKYKGLEGIQKANNTIKQGKKLKKDFQKAKKDFKELTQTLKMELKQAKDVLKEIDRLRRQDLNGFLGQLKAGFSAQGISKGLVGAQWFAKARQSMHWSQKIRDMIPKKKEEAKPAPPPPRIGKNISFPFHHHWPDFHVKEAGVSGSIGHNSPLHYSGTLTDVTSAPKIVGRPIVLNIKSQKEKGPRSLSLRAEFDYTMDKPREKIDLTYQGISLKNIVLGSVGAPVSIQNGQGAVQAHLETQEKNIKGTISFSAAPVQLRHAITPQQAKDKFLSILHDVLMKLNKLDLTVFVSDTITSPNFKIKSSLDKQVSRAVREVLNKELEDIRRNLKTRINALVNKEIKGLTDLLNSKTSMITDKIQNKEQLFKLTDGKIQKALDDLKEKVKKAIPLPNLGGNQSEDKKPPTLKDLKNIFKKK